VLLRLVRLREAGDGECRQSGQSDDRCAAI
jgi:hypothetical protein